MTETRYSENGPVVRGRIITLRPTQINDLPFLQSLWNSPEVMQYLGYPHGLSLTATETLEWWERTQRWSATHLILEARDGTAVGESGWGFPGAPGTLEIKVARAHWGKGLATDALQALLQYLWNHTTLSEVEVTPHREHLVARQLYRQLGFRPAEPPLDWSNPEYELWTLHRPADLPVRQPKALVFDWGGVLMQTTDDSLRRQWESLLALQPNAVDKAVFGSTAWQRAQFGLVDADECWAQIGAELGLDSSALSQFHDDFFAGDQLNLHLLRQIIRWKSAGQRMVLLSNYSRELDLLLDQHALRSLFDLVVLSAAEGVTKPAGWIFWRTANRLAAHPSDLLFVDDLQENVAGAKRVGLHTVHYQTDEQAITEIERLMAWPEPPISRQ